MIVINVTKHDTLNAGAYSFYRTVGSFRSKDEAESFLKKAGWVTRSSWEFWGYKFDKTIKVGRRRYWLTAKILHTGKPRPKSKLPRM